MFDTKKALIELEKYASLAVKETTKHISKVLNNKEQQYDVSGKNLC